MSVWVSDSANLLKPNRTSGLGISNVKQFVKRVASRGGLDIKSPTASSTGSIGSHCQRSVPTKNPSKSHITNPGARSLTMLCNVGCNPDFKNGIVTTNLLLLPISVDQVPPSGSQDSMGLSQRAIRSSSVMQRSTVVAVAEIRMEFSK